MLVQPWNYHDEGVRRHALSQEWRNGPYSLLLLATQLRKHGHQVMVVDMIRDLVVLSGNVEACLENFSMSIRQFRPDIIGFGFFSIHFFEVRRAMERARHTCEQMSIRPLFIGGGIHASTEPKGTINDLGFDCSFVGEADIGLLELADGKPPELVQGVVTKKTEIARKGEEIRPLDSLPFPDWSLCDYKFYSFPSFGKIKFRKCKSLDMIMGRGCVYKCAFCAYNALSAVRFYSAEYLVAQVEYMVAEFGIDAIYFTDSTIGNNRKLIYEFCELMIKRKMTERVEWYANIRPNQVNEDQLKLMWRGGCRFLFYGFESGSQRVLDLLVKGVDIDANYRAAELHNKLRFPYHASILLGYPGEREEDIQQTFEFLHKTQPPVIGVNWYVPLPGSPDYDKLKNDGTIVTEDPWEWRRIGEVNSARVYADVPEQRFRDLFIEAERLAYVDMPRKVRHVWGCLAPPQSAVHEGDISGFGQPPSNPGSTILKLLRSIRI
jgi:anaerobic magnesium-protoporphyrin IX monomethyl ester cyclase